MGKRHGPKSTNRCQVNQNKKCEKTIVYPTTDPPYSRSRLSVLLMDLQHKSDLQNAEYVLKGIILASLTQLRIFHPFNLAFLSICAEV